MPEEFEGDLSGAVFWGADLTGARFRDVNLTDATISHAWLVDVGVDAFVDRLVVNGIDVTDFVNARDPWYPLRTVLRPTGIASMRAGWEALDGAWGQLTARATDLPEAALHRSIDGEFSFVQTLRHLVFAMDKWFTAPILGGSFTPFGLPNTGSIDFPWPGLDHDRAPSLTEVLDVRADQSSTFSEHLATLSDDDLAQMVDVLENGPHEVRVCIATVLEEGFWHLRYADRDLAVVEANP
jgi:hypothetical protein